MSSLRSRLCCAVTALLALQLPAQAQQDAQTPRRLIEHLGVEIRQLLEDPKATRTPQDAEQAVAAQITALIARSEGDEVLTQPDSRGRTPLMLAVSGAYPLVVKALLADPNVKFQINATDTQGESAWMLANFAPALTLVACQPGALTRERAPLLPPYLRRMSTLLRDNAASVVDILQTLQAAGAVGDRVELQRAWLARCPNTTPELRQALAGDGELMATVINDAIARQLAFNKSLEDGSASVPSAPPADMKFVHVPDRPARAKPAPPLLKFDEMRCERLPKPVLTGALNWTGEMLFKVSIATRAGVVEAADFEILTRHWDKQAATYFRALILRALAKYQCEGDALFEQEFMFKVR